METLDVELPGTRHRNYKLKDHIVKNPKSPLIAARLRLQLCLRGLLAIGVHLLGHDPDADMRQCRLEDHLSLGLVVGELHVEHLVESQLLHHSSRVVAGADYMVDIDAILSHILVGALCKSSGDAQSPVIGVNREDFAVQDEVLVRVEVEDVEIVLNVIEQGEDLLEFWVLTAICCLAGHVVGRLNRIREKDSGKLVVSMGWF